MSTATTTTLQTDHGLRRLHDRTEITDLVYRLGAYLDEGRFDDMRELLVEDATVTTPGGQGVGREAVIDQARRNHPANQRFQHVTTNLLIDVEGDRAKVRANLTVTIAMLDTDTGDAPAPSPTCTIGEVYSFDLVRTQESWRFSQIQTVPLWVTGTVPRPAPVA